MAIEFDLYENPGKDEADSLKLHAKVITKDLITTKNLRESINRKCTASPADVAAVLTALSDELFEALNNGYSVHFDGLGYFSLSLRCAPDVNPKHVTASDVSVKGIKFVPDKGLMDKFKVADLQRTTDKSRHSEKMNDEEVMKRLETYFAENEYMQRKDFERLTGFNLSKASRYINRLVDSGVLKNIASKFHPLYIYLQKE